MKKKPIKKTVKDTIDYAYEMLAGNQIGVELNVKGLGFNAARVCSILVKRGIIEKTKTTGGKCIYKWVASMPPTNVLYGSIADQLAHEQKNRREKYKNAHHVSGYAKQSEPEATNEPVEKKDVLSLDSFTDQELWDELKRRGARIIDGKLVIVKEVELV